MPSSGTQEASGVAPEVGFPETDSTENQVSTNISPFNQDDDDDTNSLSSEDETAGETTTSHDVTTTTTTRRLYDNLQFGKWKRDQLQKQNTPSVSESVEANEQKSMSWLVREAERAKIIASPREYQVELFERAKQKNIIAVLDTGTGKTLIAALLLRHILEQELEDRKSGKSPRISFFLVDKVTLVFQQYEVLKANLDFPIGRLYGDGNESNFSHGFWSKQCEECMVIVCTAAILHLCLHHSFIKMEQINLLIFDEAHHAKKNHPYARIIKDFYVDLETAGKRRPRILGMTASPVDAKTDITRAAAELEGLLHSEIATVADPSIFKRSSINRPEEELVEYTKGSDPFTTPLWQKLHMLVGNNHAFKKLFTYSKECTTELGRWCADRVWQLCLTYDEAQKIEAQTERDITRSHTTTPIYVLDAERSAVREAYQTVVNHDFPELEDTEFFISNKIVSLISTIQQWFKPETDKCIIFVEQRLTVKLLTALFQQGALGLPYIRAGMLMGSNGSGSGDLGMSLKEQVLAIHKFRQGDLNCLFTTSVGEEGIDIPDCNMIIRFDLCKTMIQFIQSRGRARCSNSRFFHMVQITKTTDIQSVFDNNDNEAKLREFCDTLPEDRLLAGNDFDLDHFLSKEKTHRVYVVSSTKAKLTYRISVAVLASFVSSLPHPPDTTCAPDYIIRSIGGQFEAEVLLPDCAPIKGAIGRRAASRQIAKCSAAFEMCIKLRKNGFLDEYLQSTFAKALPLMRNARLAISSKKRHGYHMRTKPDAWSSRGKPDKLYVTVFRLLTPESLGRPSRPVAMLTRQPLPRIARFQLFFNSQGTSELECIPLPNAINATSELIEGLTVFTLRIFKDVFSKEYKSEPEKMPYYLAPILHTHEFDFAGVGIDSHSIIDWGCISTLQDCAGDIGWENEPDQIFESKFVTDPHDGSRKFYTLRRCYGLKPTDPQLPGVPKGQHKKRNRQEDNLDIWNFSISLWAKSLAKVPINHDLPVIEAEYISLRRNMLDEFEKVEDNERRCYIVLKTLQISALPIDVVGMAYTLPAIIYRLESNLIVLDACKSLGLDIRPDLALEAMTKDSDNTDEHSEEQINLQRGMGKNYERLEFLGDSFLKMSTTIALFSQIPESDEFQYHVDRMTLICNRNLFNNALELKIEESVRTQAFNRRIWYPEGLELLKGKKNDIREGRKGGVNRHHVLADKSIADVCEALIGASYMTTYEQRDFDMAIRAVTKFVNHPRHTMTKYSDYYAAYTLPGWQTADCTAVQQELARQIETKLGYKFNFPRLLRSAFTHPSYSTIYERIPNYQRLEFLGDALLDMVCVDYLYHRFPNADPQWLTEHKMAMVSNQFLGCLCVSLDFQKHMISMTGGLQREITEYVIAITEAQKQAEDEAESGGLERTAYARDFWVNEKRPPKCLPDLVEAYVGAIFVDSKFDYNQVQHFFNTYIRPYFEEMQLYDTFANKHPVTFLTSTLQVDFHCDNWRLIIDAEEDEEAPFGRQTQVLCGVIIHGEVREHAVAASGRYAKMAAAQKMLRKLEGISIDEFKSTYGCECKPTEVNERAGATACLTAI
ncbi:RNase3 domain-containing protein [Biscogniauxia sp. FL1348]|nr:RNase3 domain-containing protein [Biscogniauxia sp. FL1348]